MDKEEAGQILNSEISKFRSMKYEELTALIDSPVIFEIQRASGIQYQIEVQAFWDNPRQPYGDVRIIASIDDGSFVSSLLPLTVDFIMSSRGEFIGE